MDTFELDAIKSKWQKQPDYSLVVAATIDLKDYPRGVQDVIKSEFLKRGLEKQNGTWLNNCPARDIRYQKETWYRTQIRCQPLGALPDEITCSFGQ